MAKRSAGNKGFFASFLLKKEESSFSEEKEAKTLLSFCSWKRRG
jgi:hypothetical protein